MNIIHKIIKNQNNPQATICFLGDSVTQGSFRMYKDYDAVYHNRVKKKLNFLFPDAVINIINAGIDGTTADFGAERLERDVLSKNPDLCVVCFGLNDVNGLEEGIEKYKQALSDIFERLQNAGCEVIFMTPNMMNTTIVDRVPEQYKEYAKVTMGYQNSGLMDKYMQAAAETAKECGVKLCDCYAKWKRLAEYGIDTTIFLSNGINHPVEEMHELFANSLLETMFE